MNKILGALILSLSTIGVMTITSTVVQADTGFFAREPL
jgi:hypothetical protein